MRSILDANGLQRRVEGISRRSRQTTISPIKEMALLASTVQDAVSLGWGVPSFETPRHIREAVRVALSEDPQMGKYPDIRGLAELRRAISRRFSERWNAKVDPDSEILVTVGAQQALFSSLLTVIDDDDEVIIPCPAFSSFIDQVLFAGGKPVFVPLIESEGWRLDIDGIRRRLTPRTRAIIVNTPLNPTGTVYTDAELRALADIAIDRRIFLITDETYRFLSYDDEDIRTLNLFSIPELRPFLMGCYSFSKEYAMTGWRVGYLCAESAVLQEVMKVHDASVITAPRISQVAALAALLGPQDCVGEFIHAFRTRRDIMCTRLEKLTAMFEYHKPSGAYYILPRLRKHGVDSFAFALEMLRGPRVVVVPGKAFGPGAEHHVRLCFAMTESEITEAFDRLERWTSAQM